MDHGFPSTELDDSHVYMILQFIELFFARVSSVWCARAPTFLCVSFMSRFAVALLCFVLLYCAVAMDLKLCQANQNFNLNFFILLRSESS